MTPLNLVKGIIQWYTDNPGKWNQGGLEGLNSNGTPNGRRCIIGAGCMVMGFDTGKRGWSGASAITEVREALAPFFPNQEPAAWNDAKGRTLSEVLEHLQGIVKQLEVA